jgi:hypothetical protein
MTSTINKYTFAKGAKVPTNRTRLVPVITSWLLFFISGIIVPRFLESPVWYAFSLFPFYSTYFALFSKHERFVSNLYFDDQKGKLVIQYNHFKVLEKEIIISYEALSAKYGTSVVLNSNWRIDFSVALSIYNLGSFVCELRYFTKKGWNKEQVEFIYQEIKKRQKIS